MVEEQNDDFVFIDIQGFKTYGNKIIVKEFCLLHDDFVFHDIVKSPFPYRDLGGLYRSSALWNTYNHHGLYFDVGNTTLYQLIQSTLEHVVDKTIIVKGAEKVQWVKQIYENYCDVHCENIEEWNPFNFSFKTVQEISEVCPFHELVVGFSSCHCALAQAQELRTIFYEEEHF